jgi:hypothetical protein
MSQIPLTLQKKKKNARNVTIVTVFLPVCVEIYQSRGTINTGS